MAEQGARREAGGESFFGAKCGACGFEYRAYEGHIIPCPRCRAETAVIALRGAGEVLAIFRAIGDPQGLAAEAVGSRKRPKNDTFM